MRARIGDAGTLVLILLLLPVAIPVVGAPIALVVRLLLEIAHRLSEMGRLTAGPPSTSSFEPST